MKLGQSGLDFRTSEAKDDSIDFRLEFLSEFFGFSVVEARIGR